MTTTDPTTTAPQPATPGDLRETVAYLVFRAVDIGDTSRAAALEAADEILRHVQAAGVHAAAPGCSTCGTCMQHDSCRDEHDPPGEGDCTDCGACAACIAECADERKAASPAGEWEEASTR